MLRIGDPAPALEARSYDGTTVSLAALRGRSVVLYFYPRAGTPGCTQETRAFTEGFAELGQGGAAVIGVSTDAVERQRKFAEDCGAPFPLVPDTDRSIARAFGVLGFLGMARRVTYLIGPEGRILEVIEGMRPGPHVAAALRRFRAPPTGDGAQDSSRSK